MNNLNESRLAIIEGKWYSNTKSRRNTSVRELFDFLCNILFLDGQSYHYEMFNDDRSFKEIMGRLTNQNGIHYIYIASHGSDNGIVGSNGEEISIQKVANAMPSADNRGKCEGIYFGCCLFGADWNLEKLLTANNKVKWIAGYTKEVDFIKSSAFDLIFWKQYLSYEEGSSVERIKATSAYFRENMPGLVDELGFNISYWNGRLNKVQSL